ncbi:MAG TPA: AI-2E family transporter [Devosia sp.]|nr:AI-2E family transporter [Devosia sp.]
MSGAQFEHVIALGARIALLVVGALAVVLALALGRVILAPVCLAMVVGLMFGPLADALERRRVPSALSSAVVVLLFVGVLTLAAMLFARPISEWVARGPELWDKLRTQIVGLKQPLQAIGAVQDQLKALMGSEGALTVQVQDGGPVQDMALMAPSILADVLLFLAGLYFFLATRHHIRLSVLSLCFSRRMRWRTAHVFRDIELNVSRFLLSASAINLGVGVATSLAMLVLGMPSPLLWGVLAFVMNFVPYVGQAVMFAVLFAVGLGTEPNMALVLLPLAAYGAINLTADQIVFPHLVGKALTLNPFLIFVSIAFWLWVWGPIGGFVAVPSLLVLQSLVMHIFPTTQNLPRIVQRKLEEKAAAAAAPPLDPGPSAPPPAPRAQARRKARKAAIPASP